MFKRTLAFVGCVAVLLSLWPVTAFAVELSTPFVTSIDLKVASNTVTSFSPDAPEALAITVNFDTANYGAHLADSTGHVLIKKGTTTLKTLASWTPGTSPFASYSWDGKAIDSSAEAQAVCGTSGASCPVASDYSVVVHIEHDASPSTRLYDNDTIAFAITSGLAPTFTLSAYTLTPSEGGATLDPSTGGDNAHLLIAYTLSQQADNVSITVKDSNNTLIKSITKNDVTTFTETWDGYYQSKPVDPGTYTVEITASKSGHSNVTDSKTIAVTYNHTNKPTISDFALSPSTSFDPDSENLMISFKNNKTSYLTVDIFDNVSSKIKTLTNYNNNEYNADSTHSPTWNGTDNSSFQVNDGNYTVKITARNDYGVVVDTKVIALNDSGTSSTTNEHISGISFSPSTYEPAEDDDVEIEFDIEKDLDELSIFAENGDDKIEIFEETDLDAEDNYQITWDGEDDNGDPVGPGYWRIKFYSKKDSTSLTAHKYLNVKYAVPEIKNIYVSKSKFDNELGEFIYLLFELKDDADANVEIFEGGNSDDELAEDMSIEGDKWYAVQWDGGSYDYEDDIDLKLIACNEANEDVCDSEKITVNLVEDEVSSSKSNVTMDNISPVISEGDDSFEIFYNLEETADVTISIHKGQNGSGTKVIELLNLKDQEAGDHTITWDGKNKSGTKLAKGVYSYNIKSDLKSTDSEVGVFIIGAVGDIDGDSSDSSTSTGTVAPNVVIDAPFTSPIEPVVEPVVASCAGFNDVLDNSYFCPAIQWAKSFGVFQGYSDGSFRPYQTINRVEILKVLLEALNIGSNGDNSGTAGFTDVIPGEWYMQYISTAKNLGIFNGDSGKNTARPDDTVNRVEVLKFVFEALRVKQGFAVTSCISVSYPDVIVGSWYYDYSCAAKSYNLFDLQNGINFGPASFTNRGEAALLLYRLHLAGML